MKNCTASAFFLLSLAIPSIALCQREGMLLGLSAGINHFNQKDEYLSPLIFDGVQFASKFLFEARSTNDRHRVDASFSIGGLNADIPSREVSEKVGSLAYSYVHALNRVEPGGLPVQIWLGGGISSFAMNTDFNTTDETGYTTYDQSWYWAHTLNAVLSGEYQFAGSNSLSLRLTMPIVGLVSRPENGHRLSESNVEVLDDSFVNAASQGEVTYFWESFALFADIEYHHSLGRAFDLLASYRFGYVSSSEPASMLSTGMYMNTLTVGIAWWIH